MANFYNVESWIAKGQALFAEVKRKGRNRLFYHLRRVEAEPEFTGTSVNITDQFYGRGNNIGFIRVAEVYRGDTDDVRCFKPTIVDEKAMIIACGYGNAPKILTNYVFKNRLDKDKNKPINEVGDKKHNSKAWCIWVDAFTRSSSGEYCGFPTYARFSAQAFDRSADQPYATLFDLEPRAKHNQTRYGDPLYVFTFNAARKRWGIKLDHTTESGFRVEQI